MELIFGHKRSGMPITNAGVENQHIFVSGISGAGKSFLLKCLVDQAIAESARVIVFDYTSDWRDYTVLEGDAFQRMDVVGGELCINPLAPEDDTTDFVRAQRLTNVLLSAYRLGNRAVLELNDTVREYLGGCKEIPDIHGLVRYIRGRPLTKGIDAALEPLEALARLIHSGPEGVNIDLSSPGLLVLDFKQVESSQMRKLLIELLLRVIWDRKTASEEMSTRPLIILLDECQNVAWGEDGMAVRILREGRKFGIGGWFASQWVERPEVKMALRQASVQIYFRQERNEAKRIARELTMGTSDSWEKYLRVIQQLKVGEFVMRNRKGQVCLGRVDGSIRKERAK